MYVTVRSQLKSEAWLLVPYNNMDALERRREIRRKKILQNTEDRLKKVTSAQGAGTQHEHDFKSPVSYFNESSSKNNLAPSEDLTTAKFESQRLKPSGHEKGGDLSTEYASTHCNETDSVEQVDGCDIKEKRKRFDEVYEEQQTETGDTKTTKGTKSKSRIVIVIVYAVLCFYSSIYWPLIAQLTGFLGDVEQQSFVTPFCLLEVFFLCIPPLSRKIGETGVNKQILLAYSLQVVPGQKVNLWLLALKFCGVSPILLEKLRFAILGVLEFLTDLAMFIFVLAILQNISDLQV